MPPQRTKGKKDSEGLVAQQGAAAGSSSTPISEDTQSFGWAHPAELDYVKPEEWSCDHVIDFAVRNALFNVPKKPASRNSEKFSTLVPIYASPTTLKEILIPIRYRAPVLWLIRFLWTSIKLVLTARDPNSEWVDYKYRILHLARLISLFTNGCVDAGSGIDRKWRYMTLDRALTRYKRYWLIQEPEYVQRFYDAYGEEEYSKDILATDWRLWATRGAKPLKGFTLSVEEFDSGTTTTELIGGLRWANSRYQWTDQMKTSPHYPPLPLQLPPIPKAAPLPVRFPSPSNTSVDADEGKLAAPSLSSFLQSTWNVPSQPTAPQTLPRLYEHLRPPSLQTPVSQSQTRSFTPSDEDTPMSPGSEQLLTALVSCFATLTDNIRGLSDEVRALREERALASYSTIYTPSRSLPIPAPLSAAPSKTLYPAPENMPAPTLKSAVSWASNDADGDSDDDSQAADDSPHGS